jgi:hypothetical protein
MSDALTSSQLHRAQDVDLAQFGSPSRLIKPVFPSYFGSFSSFPQHCPGVAAPLENASCVHRVSRFASGDGFVAVV